MTGTLIAALLAAGIGLGLLTVGRGLRRRPVQLVDAVATLHRRPRPSVATLVREPDDELTRFQRHLARPGLRLLEGLGLADRGLLEERLRILDKSLERHAYEKLFAGLVGLLLPLALGLILGLNGTPVSPLLLLLVTFGLAVGGFFYPDLPLAERVADRQRAFRHALSTYLDLVSIILAGGGGTESALTGAAAAGDGWVFAEIRATLRRGELTGRTPWDMFEELGERYGIEELQELASSISLAGGHGARVRQSLVAKSEALRAKQTAEIESMAESNTEKMIVPVSIMVLGLMVFIGRGAIDAIGGTTPATDPQTPIDGP